VQGLFTAVKRVARQTALHRVAISGGCFANKLLLIRLNQLLIDDGFEVFIHRKVPAGDGGISLGQAVIAAAQMKKDSE
jgi:hydrogenase maturation protein HypF